MSDVHKHPTGMDEEDIIGYQSERVSTNTDNENRMNVIIELKAKGYSQILEQNLALLKSSLRNSKLLSSCKRLKLIQRKPAILVAKSQSSLAHAPHKLVNIEIQIRCLIASLQRIRISKCRTCSFARSGSWRATALTTGTNISSSSGNAAKLKNNSRYGSIVIYTTFSINKRKIDNRFKFQAHGAA